MGRAGAVTGKVYETIRQLFAAQNGATLASIVSYSGLPKQHVLKVLTANKELFQYKRGTSKIIRVYSKLTNDALKAAKESGQFYWEEKINYGAATIWCFPQGKNPAADKFRLPYACGGIGDSYEVFVVLKTDENEAKLRSVGMKRLDEADLSKFPGYVEWTEDAQEDKQGEINKRLVDFIRGLLHKTDEDGFCDCMRLREDTGTPRNRYGCSCEQCSKIRELLVEVGETP